MVLNIVLIFPILSQIYFIILYTDLVCNTPKETRFDIKYPKKTFVLILLVKKQAVLNFQNLSCLVWFYYLYIKYHYLYSRFFLEKLTISADISTKCHIKKHKTKRFLSKMILWCQLIGMEEAVRNCFYIYVLSLQNSIIRNITWCCYLTCMLMKLLKTSVKRESTLKEINCRQRLETTVDGRTDQKHY